MSLGSAEQSPCHGAPVLEVAGAAAALRSLPGLQLPHDLRVDADACREREPATVDAADGDSSLPRTERARDDVRATGWDDPERDAVPDAVQRLVDDTVAAEHPDFVAGRTPRELRGMATVLGAQNFRRPQTVLDLGDALLRDAARVRD